MLHPGARRSRRTGKQCEHLPLKGRRYCWNHDRAPQTAEYDAACFARLKVQIDRGVGGRVKLEEAQRRLARLARRMSHRIWKMDPTVEWSSVAVDEKTEAALHQILRERGLTQSGLLPHGRAATPRAWDRFMHAARKFYVEAITEQQLQNRLRAAIRDDAAYWMKVEAAEAYA